MASGVKVAEEVQTKFLLMQGRKADWPYLIFKIANDKQVEIEVEGKPSDTFAIFKQHLEDAKKKGEGRYAMFDVNDVGDGEQLRGSDRRPGKLLFVLWCDDEISIKQKMLYSSSKLAVAKACPGFHKELEAHGMEDVTMESFREKVGK